MPPKRKTVMKSQYTVNLQVDIPASVVDAARLLPEKECNATMNRYLKEKHNINAKKLNWDGGIAPTKSSKAAAAPKKGAASAAAASAESESDALYDDEF